MMKNNCRLIDLFPEWLTGDGIFNVMDSKGVPWKGEVTPSVLDIEFFGNYAGNKKISPLLRRLISDNQLSTDSKDKLADIITSLFNRDWVRLWDALQREYNPIENYAMIETMTDDRKVIEYGKTIDDDKTIDYGKTVKNDTSTTYGKQTKTTDSTEYGKQTKTTDSTEYGKKSVNDGTTNYGKVTDTTDNDDLTRSTTSKDTTTESGTNSETKTNNYGKTDTVKEDTTLTKTGNDTLTPNLNTNTNESVYGFNSSAASPSSTAQQSQTGNQVTKYDTTESTSKNVTNTLGGEDTETIKGETGKNSSVIGDNKETVTDTKTGKITESGTDTNKVTISDSGTDTKNISVGESGTDTRTDNVTESGTDTVKNTNTESGADTESNKVIEGGSDTETRNYQLTRTGNIGVTTSQQMLESEYELRKHNFFIEVVFPNVCDILTLKIY